MKNEIWKSLYICNKTFYVSNYGNIKYKNKILKKYKTSGNYDYVSISINNKTKHFKVHRLVAETCIPNLDNKPQVNHIDGNKQNNKVENLEWVTNSENIIHAYQTNLMKKTKRKNIKINQYDLEGNFVKSWIGYGQIEKTYNVSRSTIRFCCLNKINTCKGYIWRYAD